MLEFQRARADGAKRRTQANGAERRERGRVADAPRVRAPRQGRAPTKRASQRRKPKASANWRVEHYRERQRGTRAWHDAKHRPAPPAHRSPAGWISARKRGPVTWLCHVTGSLLGCALRVAGGGRCSWRGGVLKTTRAYNNARAERATAFRPLRVPIGIVDTRGTSRVSARSATDRFWRLG